MKRGVVSCVVRSRGLAVHATNASLAPFRKTNEVILNCPKADIPARFLWRLSDPFQTRHARLAPEFWAGRLEEAGGSIVRARGCCAKGEVLPRRYRGPPPPFAGALDAGVTPGCS